MTLGSAFPVIWLKPPKFLMGHMTWPYQGRFVVRRLGLAMFNSHTKFEVSTITCNEDTKCNVKCKKNPHFEPHFGGLTDNTQNSSMGLCKAHCRLPVSDNWTYLLALTAEALLSETCQNWHFWRDGSLWAQILGTHIPNLKCLRLPATKI